MSPPPGGSCSIERQTLILTRPCRAAGGVRGQRALAFAAVFLMLAGNGQSPLTPSHCARRQCSLIPTESAPHLLRQPFACPGIRWPVLPCAIRNMSPHRFILARLCPFPRASTTQCIASSFLFLPPHGTPCPSLVTLVGANGACWSRRSIRQLRIRSSDRGQPRAERRQDKARYCDGSGHS